MADFLTHLTMAPVRTFVAPEALADAAPPQAHPDVTNVPIYSNFKALQFPGIAALVKTVWLILGTATHMPVFTSVWFPLIVCVALGLLITINDLQAQKGTWLQNVGGLLVGVLNSIVVFGAVVGIGPSPPG